MAEETNKGRDAISPAPVNNIASLFKKWFRNLPDPAVNMEFLPKFRDAYDDNTCFQFAESLPTAHWWTPMYLVGFFQRLVKSEAVSLMGAKDLAIVFGPNIVQPNDINEVVLKPFADIAIELMTTRIRQCIHLTPICCSRDSSMKEPAVPKRSQFKLWETFVKAPSLCIVQRTGHDHWLGPFPFTGWPRITPES